MTNSPVVLVTGAAGFAGSHLLDLLQEDDLELVAWRRSNGHPLDGRHSNDQPPRRACWMTVDLLDRNAVHRAIHEIRPMAVYHCAGAPHVGKSWDKTSDKIGRAHV